MEYYVIMKRNMEIYILEWPISKVHTSVETEKSRMVMLCEKRRNQTDVILVCTQDCLLLQGISQTGKTECLLGDMPLFFTMQDNLFTFQMTKHVAVLATQN
jgi:hypothetical protein